MREGESCCKYLIQTFEFEFGTVLQAGMVPGLSRPLYLNELISKGKIFSGGGDHPYHWLTSSGGVAADKQKQNGGGITSSNPKELNPSPPQKKKRLSKHIWLNNKFLTKPVSVRKTQNFMKYMTVKSLRAAIFMLIGHSTAQIWGLIKFPVNHILKKSS